jgi:soluble P-type ATPase
MPFSARGRYPCQEEKGTQENQVKTIDVPGYGPLELGNVVLDLNGTVTESGGFIVGVLDDLKSLRSRGFKIYILSGDTRGNLGQTFEHAEGIEAVITKTAQEKRAFVESIGPEHTVCIGNGNIDAEMFKVARLSICTVQAEGAACKALLQADVVVTHIRHAMGILLDPNKLIATLRG